LAATPGGNTWNPEIPATAPQTPLSLPQLAVFTAPAINTAEIGLLLVEF
jgi:hypothetical protein